MATSLNIPKVIHKPIVVAKSRPQKILQALSDMNNQNPLESAACITSELEILNCQKMPTSNKIQALEAFKSALTSNADALGSHYQNAMLQLQDELKLTANAVELLC
jgi:hypothetical protein